MIDFLLAIGAILQFLGIILGIFYRPLAIIAVTGVIVSFIAFKKIPKNHNFY